MPPRVTYWTGAWDPAKEAISKEVNSLRVGDRADAPVVAFAPGHAARLHVRERVLTLPSRYWPALRAIAPTVERRGDISHVFGGQVSWHILRALRRRPILLTAVVASDETTPLPASNIVRVAVESEGAVDEWIRLGIPRARIEIVRPGIDLDRYSPMPAPSGRFTLLFASTPPDAREIEGRGIALLVEVARSRPDVDVVVPWRRWGNVEAAKQALDALRPPPNFIVRHDDVADMRAWFARAHATIVCFTGRSGKVCPTFVIEGLACARPCISTSENGLAKDVARRQAGIVADRSVRAISSAIDRLHANLPDLSRGARALADDQFSLARFVANYVRIYGDIASEVRLPAIAS